jgi:hypothetical protein
MKSCANVCQNHAGEEADQCGRQLVLWRALLKVGLQLHHAEVRT